MAISAEAALLERERELAELEELLAAARAGSGRLLLVEAAAGLGKTRLLREARRRADACGDAGAGGARHRARARLSVRCGAPAVRAAACRRRSGGASAGSSTDRRRPARPLLDPELSSEPEWADGGRGDPSFATLHGLYWFVANLVESGPALVAVDDAHWADSASLGFLAFLLPRLEDLPVLLLLALRPEEPGRRGRAGETAVRSSRWTLVPGSAERRGGGAAGRGRRSDPTRSLPSAPRAMRSAVEIRSCWAS